MPVAVTDRASLRLEAEDLAARYPALLAEAEHVAAIVAQGVHGRRRPGQGESFWQYRNYTHSDSVSDIDWRRSARSDHYYVRENEWEAANSIWFWRDGSPGMDWRSNKSLPTKKDRATVLMIALSSLLMRAGERCAVLGISEKPHTGRFGIERIATKLLMTDGTQEDLNANFSAYSKVVLASDFLEPMDALQDRLARLSARPASGLLLHIIDPAEANFPFKGRLKLFEPGAIATKIPFLLGRAEKVRENYINIFQAHQQAVADTATRLGWTLVVHHTDQPATKALNAMYAALSRDG